MWRLLTFVLLVLLAAPAAGQSTDEDEYRRLAARLSADRLGSADPAEEDLARAFALLDGIVLAAVHPPAPDLEALAARLAALAGAPPRVGESYRLVALDSAGRVFAVAANLGFAGPAAARVYACDAAARGACRLVGSVDAVADPDLFDENLQLVPLGIPEPVFLVITGLADELATGMFSAWRVGPAGLERLWASGLVSHSRYRVLPDGVELSYCAEPDPQRFAECRRMTTERWAWREGGWRRLPAGAVSSSSVSAR